MFELDLFILQHFISETQQFSDTILTTNFRICGSLNSELIENCSIAADCTNDFLEKIDQNEGDKRNASNVENISGKIDKQNAPNIVNDNVDSNESRF